MSRVVSVGRNVALPQGDANTSKSSWLCADPATLTKPERRSRYARHDARRLLLQHRSGVAKRQETDEQCKSHIIMAQNRRDPTSDWPARPGDAGGRPQHIAVHDQGSQRRQPSATPSERTQRDSSPELGHPDDWSNIEDPLDRRRVQNRLAQRKFREKARQKKESTERDSENKRLADGAYRSPAPEELNDAQDLSGVPWGSLSMAHVIKAGRAKTQSEASSRQPSVSTGRTPDPSTSSDVASTSHTSGSLEEGESSMFWWSNDISQPAPVGGGLGGGPVGKDAVDAWDMDFDYDFAAFDCDLAASLLAAPDAYPADDWIGQPGWRLQ